MDMQATFAERLRELREGAGLTQDALAARIRKSRPTIACYEAGQRSPDKDTLVLLASEFGVSVDYLLGRSNVKRPSDANDPDIALWLRHAGDLTPEQKKKLVEYIEWLKFQKSREET